MVYLCRKFSIRLYIFIILSIVQHGTIGTGPCTQENIMKKSVAMKCDDLIRGTKLKPAKPTKATMMCLCERMAWVMYSYHPLMNAVEGICEYWQSQGEIKFLSPLARRCEKMAKYIASVQHNQAEEIQEIQDGQLRQLSTAAYLNYGFPTSELPPGSGIYDPEKLLGPQRRFEICCSDGIQSIINWNGYNDKTNF